MTRLPLKWQVRLLGSIILFMGGVILLAIAFVVLHYMRTSGRDPMFQSDWAIVRYLAIFAGLIVGGCVVWAAIDKLFADRPKRPPDAR
jgi:hypothetical protein